MNDSPEYTKDTIVAVSTPPGKGGIGVVRVSGGETERIAERMLGSLPVPRRATQKKFLDAKGQPVDSGLAIYFPAPNSFTGESVLELQGHGGPMVMSLITETATELGARRAQPGEFSARAYLNGKLDLVQAEAIADLIDSGTAQAARAAHRSLSGAFSTAADALCEKLVALRLHVEAAIDFPEEEIDFLSDTALLKRVDDCQLAFDALQEGTSVGRVLRDGYQIVIVGKPNAGKSSLLNFLSGHDAAIVTEVAGTTRDILRESIAIDGMTVELVDTAGLRDNPGTIEAEGIRRARRAMEEADAVLWLEDATADNKEGPPEALPTDRPVIALRNKIDLLSETAGVVSREPLQISVSAKTGAGIDELKTTIQQLAGYKDLGEGAFTARQRHVDALRRAAAHFQRGRRALNHEKAGEIFAEELRLSQSALSSVSGSVTSDDLLGRIFSEFCIGK